MDDVQEAAPSTSGSAAALQQQEEKEVFLNRASLKQCKQLFGSTCHVKVQRCDLLIPSTGTGNNTSIATPTSVEGPADLMSVSKVENESESDTGNSYSDEDEVKILPAPPAAPLKPDRIKGYKCKKCGMFFWHWSGFQGHNKARDQRHGACPRKMRDGWRPKGAWQCNICEERMKTGNNYVTHMRSHKGEKPFRCGACGKTFVRNGGLSVHRRIHTGVWQYSCVFCDRGFHQQSNMFQHLRMHTKEKPYFCEVDGCGECFRYLSMLKDHRRLIHLKKD